MVKQKVAELEAELGELRQTLSALQKKTAELDRRLDRLEVRDEVMESPGAPGDPSMRYE